MKKLIKKDRAIALMDKVLELPVKSAKRFATILCHSDSFVRSVDKLCQTDKKVAEKANEFLKII